jgi:hypothetical protein
MKTNENNELVKVRKELPKAKTLLNEGWSHRGGNAAATAGCQTLNCPTRDGYTCRCQ